MSKYEYPHTALGANIFRTRQGSFAPDDVRDGTFPGPDESFGLDPIATTGPAGPLEAGEAR